MAQTGNQTSLYNKLVVAFVALGGTVSFPFRRCMAIIRT